MYGERSELRENGTCEQAAKPHRADLLKIFISASPRGSSIPLAVILIGDIPGWPAVNVCCTFKNAMRTKIGKVMITPFSGEKHDHSLLLWSVNDFWGLCGCFFLPFSLDLNLAEYINRQIRILRSGCQENITILNLTAFVVFKSLPKTKSVDMISNGCVDKVESNECDFWWRRRLKKMQWLWSDTSPLNSRNIVDPTQLIGYDSD